MEVTFILFIVITGFLTGYIQQTFALSGLSDNMQRRYDINIATFNVCHSFSATKSKILEKSIKEANIHILACQEISYHNIHVRKYNYLKNYDVESHAGCSYLIRQDIHVSEYYKSTSGRIYAVKIDEIILINVYFFSGSEMKQKREDLFKNELVSVLQGLGKRRFILLGDFNSIYEPNGQASNHNYSESFKQVIEIFKLCEVWKKLNPHIPLITFMSSTGQSKIDYIFCTQELISSFKKIQVKRLAFSDHLMLYGSVQWDLNLNLHESYTWHLNEELLELDSFSQITTDIWNDENNCKPYGKNALQLWVKKKKRLIYEYKCFSKEYFYDKMKLINYYQDLLTEYNQRSMKDRKWLVKVKYCQSKINKLYLQKHYGIKKRLKLEKCGLTETVNLAQVCIDKQKYNQRFINEFQNDENIIFRGNEVYEAITNQYKKFFSDNEPIKDFDILKAFNLESMNTLDENEQKCLIQPFTIEEIQMPLHS